MFTYTPLQGAQSTCSAKQSILEFDGGIKILIDVGWDEGFDVLQLAELEKHLSTLSFILLTHATTSHLGAFAHCCKHFPTFAQIPVYATTPVIAFGRTLLQDLYSSSPLAATFITPSGSRTDAAVLSAETKFRSNILAQIPTAEEIEKYFSLITPLKYSQPYQPNPSHWSPDLEGLTLTAYNSGHTVGGTIWHIQHGLESIVYAVDWNQFRENVVGGAAWFGGIGGSEVIEQLRKPTALICSSKGGDRVATFGGRKQRDELLLNNIRSCLAKGGTVLIPTDSSARILELAWVLERAWHEGAIDEPFKTSKVYLASKSGSATLRHARSLLEWMDDSIIREFEGEDEEAEKTHKRTGSKQANGQAKPARPFEFRHVRTIERKSQFERALRGSGPRVILASDLSLEWGFSKSVFQEIAQDARNLVILTQKTEAPEGASMTSNQSLAQMLWTMFNEKEHGVAVEKGVNGEQLEQVHSGGRVLPIRNVQKALLDANEIQIYQQYLATQQQLQNSLMQGVGLDVTVGDDANDDSSTSSSDDSDDEHQGKILNVSAALGHAGRKKAALTDEDLGVSILLRKKGVYDFDVQNKKGRNAIFPYVHHRKRGDEFGEYIRPEDYLRAEEKEEQYDDPNSTRSTATGPKRKREDSRKGKTESSNKRQQINKGSTGSKSMHGIVNGSRGDCDTDGSDESEEEQGAEALIGPAKAIISTSNVTANARLAFIDFAGLHDQRSLQMLIPLIGPRKLILTGGTSKETKVLASDCQALLSIKEDAADEATIVDILTPTTLETVDASVDTNAWVVKLSRNLTQRLHWQNVRNMAVVTLTGLLRGDQPVGDEVVTSSKTKKQKMMKHESPQEVEQNPNTAQPNEVTPLLDAVPPNMAASTRSATQPLHVGDMRLADLRKVMTIAGHNAEFRGEGTLLIDGVIAVKKLGTGKIIVEGIPGQAMATLPNSRGDNFIQVKNQIYQGLAIVAGGG